MVRRREYFINNRNNVPGAGKYDIKRNMHHVGVKFGLKL